jgi:O-antigen ligase
MNATIVTPSRDAGPDGALPSASGALGVAPLARTGELATTALMLVPGVLVVFMGFNAGGYFPASTAVGAIVLAQLLLVRIVTATRPLEGLAPSTLIAIGALALYAAMTLLSALWSHSLGRALVEFDRAWLYLLILALFGAVRPSTQDLRWFLRSLLAGVSIVCLAGLASRVAPDVWHTAPNVANERLSYPVTYWNTLGLLAALGIVLAFHLTCTLTERRSVRVLAGAVVPLLATTLFFTFSRGAMAAGAIGLIVYVLSARPRGLLAGALATAPGTAALIALAYHANLLATRDPTTPAAVAQGHRVALAAVASAILCAGLRLLAAVTLDARSMRADTDEPRRRTALSPRVRRGASVGLLAAIVATSLAVGLPRSLAHDWSRFIGGAPTRGASDLRQRLTDPSNNGRTDLWRAAAQGFASAPLHGRGAGMYQTIWDERRPRFVYTVNAHSLYLQALAELGVPGLLLLLVLIGAVLIALGVRIRGDRSRRSLYGVLLALSVVWALRAGVDWDWEMPVVTLGFFAAAGLALSPRVSSGVGSGPRWASARGVRTALGLLCLLGIVPSVLIVGSQRHLAQAEHALYASDCATATSAARASLGWLDIRPQPFEILGYCDMQQGMTQQGVGAMREAVRVDPGSWETYYSLAIAEAAAGVDPRRDAERALRMNPFEPLTRQAASVLRGSSQRAWTKAAAVLRTSALTSNDLSTVPA